MKSINITESAGSDRGKPPTHLPAARPRRRDVPSQWLERAMLLKTRIGELQASPASRVVLASRLGGLLAYRGT